MFCMRIVTLLAGYFFLSVVLQSNGVLLDSISSRNLNLHHTALSSCRVGHSWWKTLSSLSGLDVPICCPRQHFRVQEMQICHPWLTCSDLMQMKVKELIGYGAVKAVYRAEWNGIEMALSVLNNVEYRDDFLHGVRMLELLNPSPYVVQLVGVCKEANVVLTEYHKLGNAVHILNILETYTDDSLILRLKLCKNYASILKYLHKSPAGRRVFCDSNTLSKLLSQLLIKSDLTLVINDLDALPEVRHENNFTIKCGHQKITGSFVAPEQLWPFEDEFDDDRMPGYDEKTDIWKVVSMCNHFISTVANRDIASYHLFSLHRKCRNIDSKKRPSAEEVETEYSSIVEDIKKDY